MTKIAIIIGSTRPGRVGDSVAKWVYELSKARKDAEFELVDIIDYNLPLLDEPKPALMNQYSKEHTKVWASKIEGFDGFIFVTPEYNHATSAALKNALDFLYKEWNNKAAGFVSYGVIGGARAADLLRPVMAQLMIADVSAQVMLSLHADFKDGVFKPDPHHEKSVNALFDQVIAWSTALKTLR